MITVLAPISEHKRPDLTPLIKASQNIGQELKLGDIVDYESSVYPGCTQEECIPVLEKISGLVFNIDFFAGFSPELVNLGDGEYCIISIKKVTSGSTQEVADISKAKNLLGYNPLFTISNGLLFAVDSYLRREVISKWSFYFSERCLSLTYQLGIPLS